jgi:hypothetical protein
MKTRSDAINDGGPPFDLATIEDLYDRFGQMFQIWWDEVEMSDSCDGISLNNFTAKVIWEATGEFYDSAVGLVYDSVESWRSREYQDDVVGNSLWFEGDVNCDGDFTNSDRIEIFEWVSGTAPLWTSTGSRRHVECPGLVPGNVTLAANGSSGTYRCAANYASMNQPWTCCLSVRHGTSLSRCFQSR